METQTPTREISAEELEHSLSDSRTEYRFAAADGVDGADDFLLLRTLEDVAASSCPHGGEDRLIVLEHGQDQNGHLGRLRGQPAGCFDPILTRHPDVHHDNLWPLSERQLNGSRSVSAIAYHLDALD